MDTKALKDKILQLAIQGKLVEQDKNDEPASVLLDRIKEEREKLIKEGKIRKPKKLPSIEEEEKPFEIPEGWEWVRLGNLVEFKIGKTPKRSNADYWDNGEYPWFSISDIEDGEIIYDSKEKISEKAYTDIFKGDISPKGTLIMSFKLSIGKMSILGVDGFHNEAIISIFPICDSEEITKMYLFKIMNGLDILGDSKSAIKGATLNTTSLNNILIPLPPFAEQKRIVEKVDELFALIDELDSNKKDLLEVINLTRNQVLKEAIQGKLVKQNPEDEPAAVLLERIKEEKDKLIKEKKIRKPKKLPPIEEGEKPFDVPEGWEWVRLGEATIINPRNSFEDNQEVSFVPMALIDEGFKNNHTSEIRLWKDIKSGFTHFAENDVAVAKITPCFENRKSAIMRNLFNGIGAGTTELHIIRSVNRLIFPEYILNICKTDRFIKEGVATYTGTAGQQRIGKDYIMNLLVPLPPLAEQKRIVEKVDMIMDMLDKLEKELIINI